MGIGGNSSEVHPQSKLKNAPDYIPFEDIEIISEQKKNNVFKISGKTIDIQKDIEKNYYLPNLIFDCAEKEKDKNVMNIHRIKHNFNFLADKYFGISLSNINYDKYFNEYFN